MMMSNNNQTSCCQEGQSIDPVFEKSDRPSSCEKHAREDFLAGMAGLKGDDPHPWWSMSFGLGRWDGRNAYAHGTD